MRTRARTWSPVRLLSGARTIPGDAVPSKLVLTTARGVNAALGRHGELAASLLLDRLPDRCVPHSGVYEASRCGFDWTLDLADNLQRRLYLVGSYESLTLAVVLKRLTPSDVVLDVGANIGTFALPVAARLHHPGRLVAVEAAPDTADRLRDHVGRNGLSERVEVVEVGLSDHSGRASLHLSPFGSRDAGTRTLEGDGATTGQPVELTTGDALRRRLGLDRFDVVKIDVEGHEASVLSGMVQTFMESPPRLLVVEIVPSHQERAGRSVASLIEFFASFGYRGRAIRHRGLSTLTPDFAGNAIFER